MSRLAKLSARFIGEGGFSIGITDVTPSAALMTDKASIIGTAYEECDELISNFKGGTLSLLPGCDEDQSLEVHAPIIRLPVVHASSGWVGAAHSGLRAEL